MASAKKKTDSKLRWSKNKMKDASNIGVYLRLRPLKLDEPSIHKISDRQVKTLPPENSSLSQVYSFTKVFDNAHQSQIFQEVAQPVVEDFIVSAKDGLIFTYGITGSGKTYTMEGNRNDPGLIYRSIDFLFNSVGGQQTERSLIESDGQNSYRLNWEMVRSQREQGLYPNLNRATTPSALPSVIKWQQRSKETSSVCVDPNKYFCVFISLVELYNKQVHDLFEDLDSNGYEKKRREIRTDQQGMSYVANVVEAEVKSADEAVELYKRGISRRKIGSTALNQESSRGHCVLNLRLVQIHKSLYTGQYDEDTLVPSQLCLVDLAGSERTKRSGVTGGALHETGSINNSLGALRKCIRALRDREPTNTIQYREYSLTRLFKSYFEGHGSVRMVLCVKPSALDFIENNSAMEFGLLSQEVAVDYASPPKILRRSRSRAQDAITAQMEEYFGKKSCLYKPNPDLSNEDFISEWVEKLKADQEVRKKYIDTAHAAQREVRLSIARAMDENTSLKQQYDTRIKDLRNREDQLERARAELQNTEQSCQGMNDRIHQLERHVRHLEAKDKRAREAVYNFELYQSRNEKAYREILTLIKNEQSRSENYKRIQHLLKKLKSQDAVSSAPSAPEMEPLQSSSPVDIPNPSTTETTDSQTVPTITNSSSDAMEFHDHRISTSPIKTMTSPYRGVPIINPKHNRSLSCSSLYWLKHVPQGMDTGGSVLQPKIKNGRVVRNLKSRDLFDKKVGNYAIINQTAEPDGEVVTSVTKGNVIRTPTNGVQVHFNDVETMKQESPKRRRAVSDAQFGH